MRLVLSILILFAFPGSSFAWEAQTFTEDPESGWEEQSFDPSEAGDSKAAAQTNAREANSQLGNAGGLNEKAVKPLTGKRSSLATLSGESRGSATLSNASSSAFLQIFIRPGKTGDLDIVYASQDLDFDGRFDHTFSPSKNVSGVCSNGYVSCDPGTWNSCSYWSWGVKDAKLMAHETTVTGVSGCYCINNSCGTSLALKNMEHVLNSLGGGASGVLTAANPNYQITQAEVQPDNLLILFYGQDVTDQAKDQEGFVIDNRTVTQTDYYSRGAAVAAASIEADTETLVRSQSASSLSNYSLATSVIGKTGKSLYSESCLIERNIVHGSDTYTCDEPVTIDDRIVLSERNTKYYYQVFLGRIAKPWSSEDCKIGKVPGLFPEYHWTPTDGAVLGTTADPPDNSSSVGKYWYIFLDCIKLDGPDTGVYNAYEYYMRCDREMDYIKETIGDGCASLADNPDCILKSETVDGVEIMRNGVMTGLVPETGVVAVVGNLGSYEVARPWWQKYRTYQCNRSSEKFNFDDAIKRSKTGSSTAGDAENKSTLINYTDMSKDPNTGLWTSNSESLSLAESDPTVDCEKRCKIKRSVTSTDMTLVGSADERRADNTGESPLPANEQWRFVYAACSEEDVCPTKPGDILLKGCQCLSEFAEVTAVMEALNQAGKDVICSDGVPK